MSSPSLIASFGHPGSQAPQLMHSSVMYVAIDFLVKCRGPGLERQRDRVKQTRNPHCHAGAPLSVADSVADLRAADARRLPPRRLTETSFETPGSSIVTP